MIAFVKGTVAAVLPASVIVDNSGIGYEISVSPGTLAKVSGMKEVQLYTYFQASDSGIGLFGFLSREELSMFHMLISVSGIGPKSALAILASASPQELTMAIITDDVKAMSKLPGVGKKTAGRLILELRDKLLAKSNSGTEEGIFPGADLAAKEHSPAMDAVDALTVLGYGRSEAMAAVAAVQDEHMSVEEMIKAALKKFVSGRGE